MTWAVFNVCCSRRCQRAQVPQVSWFWFLLFVFALLEEAFSESLSAVIHCHTGAVDAVVKSGEGKYPEISSVNLSLSGASASALCPLQCFLAPRFPPLKWDSEAGGMESERVGLCYTHRECSELYAPSSLSKPPSKGSYQFLALVDRAGDRVSVSVCVYLCMYICVFTYLYTYIHRQFYTHLHTWKLSSCQNFQLWSVNCQPCQ